MKKVLAALSLVLVQAVAWAQASAEFVSGEVRKIDKAQKKVTLRHGELKAVEMPAMTMAFVVREPAQLDTLKVGDKVVFKVAKEADGAVIVTDIQRAR